MDNDLGQRYAALFDLFEPRDSFLALLKPLILSAAARHGIGLRPDAAYFLLVNLAEMVLRPYAEPIPVPPVWWERGEQPGVLPMYRDFTYPHTVIQIEKSLDVIMSDLPSTGPELTSSHEVMKAIDRNWNKLAKHLGWG